MEELEHVSIAEAAERLGIAADTVRRRLKRGELQGVKEPTAQGFVWRVALPKASTSAPTGSEPAGSAIALARLQERIAGLERLADELQSERNAWREQAAKAEDSARELRILLRQAQELALPVETTRPAAPERVPVMSSNAGSEPDTATRPERRWRLLDWLRRR